MDKNEKSDLNTTPKQAAKLIKPVAELVAEHLSVKQLSSHKQKPWVAKSFRSLTLYGPITIPNHGSKTGIEVVSHAVVINDNAYVPTGDHKIAAKVNTPQGLVKFLPISNAKWIREMILILQSLVYTSCHNEEACQVGNFLLMLARVGYCRCTRRHRTEYHVQAIIEDYRKWSGNYVSPFKYSINIQHNGITAANNQEMGHIAKAVNDVYSLSKLSHYPVLNHVINDGILKHWYLAPMIIDGKINKPKHHHSIGKQFKNKHTWNIRYILKHASDFASGRTRLTDNKIITMLAGKNIFYGKHIMDTMTHLAAKHGLSFAVRRRACIFASRVTNPDSLFTYKKNKPWTLHQISGRRLRGSIKSGFDRKGKIRKLRKKRNEITKELSNLSK